MTHTAPGATGLAVLEMAQAGRFEEIRELFAPPLRSLVSADGLRAAWSAEIGRHGRVTSVGAPVSEPTGVGAVEVKIPVTFARGELAVVMAVTEDGWLTGIQLLPASAAQPAQLWQPPPYADPDAFTEQDVTVGDGPMAVPGTLSLPSAGSDPATPPSAGSDPATPPHDPRPCPAVVLLPGSGPQDRDETIGRNKPLKDLAWGLASRGVGVLRFDKVTYVHARQLAQARDFTLSDEYLPQAVAAIRLLTGHPAVDGARVFVAGHSLGGTVAPRVAAAEPSAAGLVILAGGTQPLPWAAVRQLRYIASLDPQTAAASQPAIDALARQASVVDSPGLSAATPDSDLPFGIPAAYWLDLRGYDPAAAAAAVGKPVLILQGGRDYQATVAEDLAGWRAGLAGRPDITIRVYESDNHLFFPGTGPSSPAEYEPAQHMDPAVIADIVSWLTMPEPG
jgi:uncharacterized protein